MHLTSLRYAIADRLNRPSKMYHLTNHSGFGLDVGDYHFLVAYLDLTPEHLETLAEQIELFEDPTRLVWC